MLPFRLSGVWLRVVYLYPPVEICLFQSVPLFKLRRSARFFIFDVSYFFVLSLEAHRVAVRFWFLAFQEVQRWNTLVSHGHKKMPDAENKQIKDIVTWLVNCINTVFAWMQKDVNLNYHVKHVPFTLEECHSPNWLISVVEVVAFMKQSCLLGEMFYGSLSQEMFEVYFSAENKSSMIRRDDLKMIWWLVLFLQNLCRSLILTYYFQNMIT